MLIEAFRKYRQASGPLKLFLWTVATLISLLIITTLWAFARLDYARTNIPSVPLEMTPPIVPRP